MSVEREETAKRVELAMVGCTVARAHLGVGSILLLDLVSADMTRESTTHIRVECAWRIDDNNSVLAASEDSRAALDQQVRELNGKTIQGAVVRRPSFEFEIVFGNQRRLFVFPIYANNVDYENWTLHLSSDAVIVAGPGREVRTVSSNSA